MCAVVLRRRLPEFLGQRIRSRWRRPRRHRRRSGGVERLRRLRLDGLEPFLHRLIAGEVRQVVVAQKIIVGQQQIVAQKLLEQGIALDAVVHGGQVCVARSRSRRQRRGDSRRCRRHRHHSRTHPHRSTRRNDPRIRISGTDSLRPITIRSGRIPMRSCHNPIGGARPGLKRPSRKIYADLLRRSRSQLSGLLGASETANGNPVVRPGKRRTKQERKSGQSTHSAP